MLTLVREEGDNLGTRKIFKCDFVAECDGTSIWSDTTGKKCQVTQIIVDKYFDEDGSYTEIWVTHDGPWEIYTDKGFEAAISEVLGVTVCFTEQGWQADCRASMELVDSSEEV